MVRLGELRMIVALYRQRVSIMPLPAARGVIRDRAQRYLARHQGAGLRSAVGRPIS